MKRVNLMRLLVIMIVTTPRQINSVESSICFSRASFAMILRQITSAFIREFLSEYPWNGLKILGRTYSGWL